MTIEEGDQVVTPINGMPIGEVEECQGYWESNEEYNYLVGGMSFPQSVLKRTTEPIRVRVSRECYAESLVALAEECGFDSRFNVIPEKIAEYTEEMSHYGIEFDINREWYISNTEENYDLTYRDDLPQIEGWLEANAKSEDDQCETCGGDGVVDKWPKTNATELTTDIDCPDCTDGSGNYSQQQPEDEELPNTYKDFRPNLDELREEIGEGMTGYIEWLEAVINELKTELKTCWENQQEYKAHVAELMEKLQDVREEQNQLVSKVEEQRKRIEEARARIKTFMSNSKLNPRMTEPIVRRFNEILKILSDSDEGDGCVE